ncbi:MAG: sulfatase/phosphatase domain-containing protein, partial [Candidatus Poribacteria bacterium]
SARVPFVLRLPSSYSSQIYKRGQKISVPIELRDIFPTFCEIAQIDIPPSIDGRSLLSLCKGENNWREYIHGEHTGGNISNHWITDGKEKYIWFSQTGREMFFYIADDPQELHDLSKKYPDRLVFWREKLILELANREEGFVQDGKLITGRPQSPTLRHAGKGLEG